MINIQNQIKNKKLLLIATGGTIASRHTENGLSPQISGGEQQLV